MKTKSKRSRIKNKNKKTKKNTKIFLNMRGCYKKQKGGMMPPLNNAILVGKPWSGTSTSTGNYYELNTYKNQVDRLHDNETFNMIPKTTTTTITPTTTTPTTKMNGGGRFRGRNKKKGTKKQKGGLGTVIFDQMGADLTNAYKTWQGQDLVVSPLPFKDQIYYGPTSENNINSIIMK